MKVNDWMTSEVITVNPEDSIQSAWNKILTNHIRQLPVVVNSKVVGIVSRTDLLRRLTDWLEDENEGEVKVREVMTLDPTCVRSDAPIERAASRLYKNRLSCLPVVDERDEIVGILSKTDLFRAMAEITGFQGSVHRREYTSDSSLDDCISHLEDVPSGMKPKSFIATQNEDSGEWSVLIHHIRVSDDS